ncbi:MULTISPECIES: helix-turn-helix transcriptional regulator [unclassified Pseudomonas]|uniref:AraC family transcriptional regulator n=1 Tax=unclassified Pseudomonas TaxID=196821 RepID=UPI00244A3241|nr:MULTISPECIES: helix-turn-helix transcriptional regulator [unclassified Pseudomonas]MDH0895100.1 helix-turn-helix transcriptional regulator [Pseudomonas sp. GD03875]MDH1064860.1 helix-turn-helix transcriptional regulator [Pseudomonas sp. GD03985]
MQSDKWLDFPSHSQLAALPFDYPDGHWIEPHSHPQAQFLHAVAGMMRLVTARGAWIIPPGRAVWIPPGLRHEIFVSGELRMRPLFIPPQRCPAGLEDCCVLVVTPLLRELILRASDGHPEEDVRELIEQLILRELAALERLPLHLPMPRDRRLQAICRALLQSPEHPYRLEDWAQQAGASSHTLARLFRQELQMSYQQWRQQLSLTEALPRLLAGASVQEVAHALGYGSGRAFSAMFRRLLGENPREYLKALNRLAELRT